MIALGDVRAARGDAAGAADAYALVRAMETLFAQAGGNNDLELALFDANHAQPGADLDAVVAQARTALAERPSVVAHDALGWALFKAGQLRRRAARGPRGDGARHGRPAGPVPPRRHRGLRRRRGHGARRAEPRADPQPALPPPRRARRAVDPRPSREAVMRRLVPVLAALALLLAVLPAAGAHPLGNFTVNQYTAHRGRRERRRARLRARPGGDPDVPGAEPRRRATATGSSRAAETRRRARPAGGEILPPAGAAGRRPAGDARVDSSELRFLDGQGGLQTTRLDLRLRRRRRRARLEPRSPSTSATTTPTDRVGWREIVVAREAGTAVLSTTAATPIARTACATTRRTCCRARPTRSRPRSRRGAAPAASPSRACARRATSPPARPGAATTASPR